MRVSSMQQRVAGGSILARVSVFHVFWTPPISILGNMRGCVFRPKMLLCRYQLVPRLMRIGYSIQSAWSTRHHILATERNYNSVPVTTHCVLLETRHAQPSSNPVSRRARRVQPGQDKALYEATPATYPKSSKGEVMGCRPFCCGR